MNVSAVTELDVRPAVANGALERGPDEHLASLGTGHLIDLRDEIVVQLYANSHVPKLDQLCGRDPCQIAAVAMSAPSVSP